MKLFFFSLFFFLLFIVKGKHLNEAMNTIELNKNDIELVQHGQYVKRLSKNKKLKEEFLCLDLLNNQLILSKTKSCFSNEKTCKKN